MSKTYILRCLYSHSVLDFIFCEFCTKCMRRHRFNCFSVPFVIRCYRLDICYVFLHSYKIEFFIEVNLCIVNVHSVLNDRFGLAYLDVADGTAGRLCYKRKTRKECSLLIIGVQNFSRRGWICRKLTVFRYKNS